MAKTTGIKYGGRQKGTPNRLIKLMPFVFPRMNTMSHSVDEPVDWC